MLSASMQKFDGRVELFNGSTLERVCTCEDVLINFTIERIGTAGKFFGFGVCQRLTVNLIDTERELNITKAHSLEVEFGVNGDFIYPCPCFFVEEVTRDEQTNDITIIAYDALYKASNHTVAELALAAPYTIKKFMEACATLLNIPSAIVNVDDESFSLAFESGANFEGSETIRAALDAIAEATQTIYYIDSEWRLVFKRYDADGAPVLTIDKDDYFSLGSGESQTLATISHITELGDNTSATTGAEGATQYIRDNPFWALREDIGALVDSASAAINGLTIGQFTCEDWIGNFLLEIGDKIAFIAEDGSAIYTYLLDDTLSFDGTLAQRTQWQYIQDEAETASNPTSLGEALKHTFARVDKVNNEITLVTSAIEETRGATEGNTTQISELRLNTQEIGAAVERAQADIDGLSERVSLAITADQLSIEVEKQIDGITEVTTNTGFTFNDDGLTVTKSNSELETKITDDGMRVARAGETVLTANNEGVKATDLQATTFLIVGNNSRFMNFESNRTGCFWIGGQ